MDHQSSYTYTYQPRQRSPSTASSRSGGAYQNSSAFSASANPDEDWTKISDLAERRRIQNRIAQRNYRKKLKRRLEDLERRTTSSSASPEQSHRELAQSPANEFNAPGIPKVSRRASAPRASVMAQEQQYSADALLPDDGWINQTSNNKSAFSFSAPSAQPYPDSFHRTAEYFPDNYGSTPYSRMPILYSSSAYTPEFIQSTSPSLPSMVPLETYKTEQQYLNGELLTPFNMSYASLAGFSAPPTHGSSGYASRTPPLTASSLYFDSRNGSPQQFTLPMTPESRSASPNIALFDHIEV